MKAIMLSIRPKWCGLIASGKKTVEVRKTKPKLKTPFKVYIYCTKDYSLGEFYTSQDDFAPSVQGKVIGEFVCDKVAAFRVFKNGTVQDFFFEKLNCSCLSYDQIAEYIGRDKVGYAWHISDLVIYDKPKSLGEFNHCGVNYHFDPPITKPPPTWCYVEEV